jgi:hypothetical protein
MPTDELIITGAKQNNLKGFDLRLPHNKVIAVTGVSGSGKSSLAFDTLFAEGQWRFIESLSTYARLFLEKLDRPDVKAIENIRPAIALEQRNPVRGSRSTVGTLTELYDLLRLLYSKTGVPHCPGCGQEVRKWDASAITAELLVALEYGLHLLFWQPVKRLVQVNARLGRTLQQLPLPPLGRGLFPYLKRTLLQREVRVGHYASHAVLEHVAEALALLAGAHRVVERKQYGAGLGQLHAAEFARVVLAETQHRPVHEGHLHMPMALPECVFYRIAQAGLVTYDEPVQHHVNSVTGV